MKRRRLTRAAFYARLQSIERRRRVLLRRMDLTWLTDRLAVGGGIWSERNMAEVARAGVTHIINMQIEFDDRPLAEPLGIKVLWSATVDDFQLKPPELFDRGVEFALAAFEGEDSKVFTHCAAGIHRSPMMALAILCATGWEIEKAMDLIEGKRPTADFADVYVDSVERYLEQRAKSKA